MTGSAPGHDRRRDDADAARKRRPSAAAAKNVPISSHFFTEYSLAVGGSEVGCRTIESIDWFQPLFNEAPELVDGQLVVPDRPGHGFTFNRKAVAHHAVD